MPPHSGPSRDAADDLHLLQTDPLKVGVVVEAAVGQELLEEGNQHRGAVLVGLG